MNGIIIVNQHVGHNEYKIKRFLEEFSKINIDLQVFKNDGTLAKIENSIIKCSLPRCDFVLYLDKDIYLARLLEKAGFRLFNKADFIKMCDDKMLTFIRCSNLNIKMPKTISGPLVYTDLSEENYAFLNKIVEELGFPMIVKKVYGSLGEGVYLVKNYEELRNLYSQIYRNPILFQEYIPSEYGQSVRVIVIDKKVIGGFVRYNENDFRSNYGDQANGKKIENPEKCFKFVQEVADLLDIEYAGFDLLLLKDESPTLCEINSNAFFEEFESVTGINVAEKYAKMVKEKITYEQKLQSK